MSPNSLFREGWGLAKAGKVAWACTSKTGKRRRNVTQTRDTAVTREEPTLVRGADAIADALRQEGVKFLGGVTGGSTFELFDAIRRGPRKARC